MQKFIFVFVITMTSVGLGKNNFINALKQKVEQKNQPAAAAPAGDPVKNAWTNTPSAKDTCNGNAPISQSTFFTARGALCALQSQLTLGTLEKISGQKVFLSGPHSGGFNFTWGQKDFGKYNPDFLKWAINNAVPGAADSGFKTATQTVYDTYFKKLAEIYLTEYYALKKNPANREKFKGELAAEINRGLPSNEGFFYSRAYNKTSGEAAQALAFWVRRSIDNTFDLFGQGLEKLVTTYDPQTLQSLQQKINAPEVAKAPPAQNSQPVDLKSKLQQTIKQGGRSGFKLK